MSAALPYVPRNSEVLSGATISRDYDKWLQDVANAVNGLITTVLSGPDADPNTIVVGSPGDLYRALGPSVTTSKLYVKESGVNTKTGWVLK